MSDQTTFGRRVVRFVAGGLLAQIIPTLTVIATVPVVVGAIGVDRYGAFAMLVVVLAYAALFDLGVGVAVTRDVAARGEGEGAAESFWSGFWGAAAIGAFAAVLLALFARPLAVSVMRLSADLEGDAVAALRILAVGIPALTTMSVLVGLLTGLHRMSAVNGLALAVSLVHVLAPVAALVLGGSLTAMSALLVVGRAAVWAWAMLLCLSRLRGAAAKPSGAQFMRLLRFGGWVTVSGVVSPLMSYMDRVVVGALLSPAAVAFYATPAGVVARGTLFATVVASTLFSPLARALTEDAARAAQLFRAGVKYAFVVTAPLCLVLAVLAEPLLSLWLGEVFAAEATAVLQWLSLGIFFNALAQLPYCVIQAAGRSDITGRLHLAELPLWALALALLCTHFGITGAAMAWTLRCVVDSLALFVLSGRFVAHDRRGRLTFAAACAVLVMVGGAGITIERVVARLSFVSAGCVAIAISGWLLLSAEERAVLKDLVARRTKQLQA